MLGAITALALAVLLTLLIFATIDRLFYAVFIGDEMWVSRTEELLRGVSSGLFHLTAALFAAFCGGVVAGGSDRAYPGVRGAASAMTAALAVLLLLAAPLLLWMWDPVENPGEAYTRSETLSNLLVVGVVLCVVSPFAVLAGYLGGRFGRSFLRLVADR